MSNEHSKHRWENIVEEKGQNYQIAERNPRFIFWTCRIALQTLYFLVGLNHSVKGVLHYKAVCARCPYIARRSLIIYGVHARQHCLVTPLYFHRMGLVQPKNKVFAKRCHRLLYKFKPGNLLRDLVSFCPFSSYINIFSKFSWVFIRQWGLSS